MRSIAIGLLLAAVTAAFLALLPDDWARGAAANLLTLIAAIDAAVLLAYASSGALGAARLGQTARGARRLDVVSGVLLLGMAAGLALWKRA